MCLFTIKLTCFWHDGKLERLVEETQPASEKETTEIYLDDEDEM